MTHKWHCSAVVQSNLRTQLPWPCCIGWRLLALLICDTASKDGRVKRMPEGGSTWLRRCVIIGVDRSQQGEGASLNHR